MTVGEQVASVLLPVAGLILIAIAIAAIAIVIAIVIVIADVRDMAVGQKVGLGAIAGVFLLFAIATVSIIVEIIVEITV